MPLNPAGDVCCTDAQACEASNQHDTLRDEIPCQLRHLYADVVFAGTLVAEQMPHTALRRAVHCETLGWIFFETDRFLGRLQALFAEQMLRHSGERLKAAAIASKRAFIERKLVASETPGVKPHKAGGGTPRHAYVQKRPVSRHRWCCSSRD